MKLPESPQLRLFLRRLAYGVVLAAFFTWLALRQPPGEEVDARLVQREFLAMGTVISATLYLGENQDREPAETALRAVETFLHEYERRWSAWNDGELARVNARLAAGEAVQLPEPMRPLFAQAARLWNLSEGRFDVRIGRLVELWGFHDETQFRDAPPPAEDIAERLAALKDAPPLSDEAEVYGPAPQVRFDFGAIAKGEATDLALERLRAAGYANAIVNLGGNLRAAGRRGERAWRIGIRHPRPESNARVLATLEIDGDEAVVTSGDYERWFEHDGRRYHHLLDPHSGYPAQGLQAVTVVAGSGALADAASTALFVAGPAHWRALAQRLGLEAVMVVEADGRVLLTPALAARIRLAGGIVAETLP